VINVHAALVNVTEFDDGCSDCNITSNTTKYITLPLNATVLNATLNVSGVIGTTNLSSNATNNTESGVIVSDDCCFHVAGQKGLAYDEDFSTFAQWCVKAGAGCYQSDPVDYIETSIDENFTIPDNMSALVNVTLHSRYRLIFASEKERIRLFCFNQSNSLYALVFEDEKIGIGTNVIDEYISLPKECYLNNVPIKIRSNLAAAGGFDSSTLYDNELLFYNATQTAQFLIFINHTIVFNSSNSTKFNLQLNLNTTLINIILDNLQLIRFDIGGNGVFRQELNNLFIRYNKTNSALLSIVSPSQVTQSVLSGGSFTQAVNITNTGDWNASNITFETISSQGTPNYNGSISHDCSAVNILNGSSVVCNVTFSSLTQAPESDEKLRVRALNASDNLGTILSDSIDLDVTITQPVIQPGGGGGGGDIFKQCVWKVLSPANRVIQSFGYYGYKTNPIAFQIYNNDSEGHIFTYTVQGLECLLEKNSEPIQGNSISVNRVQCEFPPKADTGIIIIEADGCTQQINMGLYSEWYGLLFVYASGGAGIVPALLIYGIIIGGGFLLTRRR